MHLDHPSLRYYPERSEVPPINDKNQSEISIRRRQDDDDDTIMKHHTIHEMPETYDRENVTFGKINTIW